jgi:acetate CoA/acetoacetate CoA-transferase alpha subunit
MGKVIDIVDAVSRIKDGETLLIGGFGPKGYPGRLLRALLKTTNTKDLFFVANAANPSFMSSLDKLLATRARGMICTFMRGSLPAEHLYAEGKLELAPQGSFAERLRAGGMGIEAFYTPVGIGTLVEHGKEKATFNGRECVLERAIRGDIALVRATRVDLAGNCFMRGAVKNFTSLMPAAANYTIVEAEEIVPAIDPEIVSVPARYVNAIVMAGG